jgi:hypothetical protein
VALTSNTDSYKLGWGIWEAQIRQFCSNKPQLLTAITVIDIKLSKHMIVLWVDFTPTEAKPGLTSPNDRSVESRVISRPLRWY